MQNKQNKRKKTKKEIKVHDLKPQKEVKGGHFNVPGHYDVGGQGLSA